MGRAALVRAALDVADAEGLPSVTIRRLAKDLSVTPMALYWHVADKQALLNAMADQVWMEAWELAGPTAADEPWHDMRRIVTALVTAASRHPTVVALLPFRFIENDASLQLIERSLDVLNRLGFRTRDAANLSNWIFGSAMNLVTGEPGSSVPDSAVHELAARHKRAALLTLPPEQFPHLISAADDIAKLVSGQEHDYYIHTGIELIIGALQAKAAIAHNGSKLSSGIT